MYWKINFLLLLYIVQSFGLLNVQTKISIPAVNVSYQNGNNNIALDVLKKAYAGLTGETDSGNNGFPNTDGLSLHGHQGFMWNMLNNASRHFKLGAKGGGFLKAKKLSPQNLGLNVSAELDFNQPPHNNDPNKLNKEKKEYDGQNETQVEIEAEDDQNLFLELINKLLEDEEFWNWLADWTEAYTNLLDKHIKISVTTEVSKQINEFFQKFDNFFNSSNHKAEEKVEEKDDNKSNAHTCSWRHDSPQYDTENEGLTDYINVEYICNRSVHNQYITTLHITK